MKQEELYRSKYRSQREFKESVAAYIDFYNTRRPHSVFRYQTPEQFEKHYFEKIQSDTHGS
jgi:transposase InsO family protein